MTMTTEQLNEIITELTSDDLGFTKEYDISVKLGKYLGIIKPRLEIVARKYFFYCHNNKDANAVSREIGCTVSADGLVCSGYLSDLTY